MVFSSPLFLFLFLPVLLALYFVPLSRRHARYGNSLLLVASVVFYLKGGGAFTWLILGSIIFNYWMAIGIDRTRETDARRWVGVAVAVNLSVLAWFKYANFFADNVNSLFFAFGVPPFVVSPVVLPIGISFFTFHAISYVVDVYRRDATAQKSQVHAALYLLLFPQLIAGPIIRYRDIADQLPSRVVGLDDFSRGVSRFIVGLGKKVLIANTLAKPADQVFALPLYQLTLDTAWLGILCYTLQIYFDFSGYSDMAIGLGRMFGFRFPENFRWPYAAETVQEFWRRWHMSLSAWFRDYVYVPLGGSHVPPVRMYINLVTVFFLCGLWHGASWNFVMWGLFHGLFLVCERLGLARAVKRLWAPLRHAYLLVVVIVGWVLFRADTLSGAGTFLLAMVGFSRAASGAETGRSLWLYLNAEVAFVFCLGCIGSMPLIPWLQERRRLLIVPQAGTETRRLDGVFAFAQVFALATVFVLCAMALSAGTYNPFIYYRF